MKKILSWLIIIGGSFYLGIYCRETIINYGNLIINHQNKVVVPAVNEYKKADNFLFVQNTDIFIPTNRQDLLNIYYTTLNSGWDSFTFYCGKKYKSCITDVENIANDQSLLSHINNYVSPLNAYSQIRTKYDTFGTVTIINNKTYDESTRKAVQTKVDEIYNSIVTSNMTTIQKIRAIHDYIINHTKYDSDRANNNIVKYHSDTAYGVLYEGYGLCSGYADTMAIFLDKLGVKNYRIASAKHVWNYVYLDNAWYHLDLSWDDPVSSDGRDILDETFFLIDTAKLESLHVNEHIYPKDIYLEAR